ncbi:MAG: hypothetical protein A3E07_02390 [Candidatus Wildermuthbacteria bacterium RIFCSPHIGHO2_12_FULL_45_9]|uniref:Lycopene cyclase domain-containing protein n=1 Tax=Candidatus Wildermuthbacteria bacterium RIFCSPHIGHO2_02_FULL_45_25 TaxID=1802450 RepID=A0A1G2R2W9_9BACT|nr:MAG: hypothetical protein A2748_02430 [Candidatus Wildermuthbacteria bacterium RIFCSPHIGHO2_01_FULL_45_20]OHA67133.1 MAG: hypothetical protein A3C04_02505 [Candidatus Wildermuthbacteria bacterium RIFCSPHIGHO2_02_FULL_45_25]OHA70802.1 MAG: hypothetical protein A3E07_02390 [Candidatus Wildermuthbacteria bacterium RIFCSPHIGHO2_12_FULL_45_9]
MKKGLSNFYCIISLTFVFGLPAVIQGYFVFDRISIPNLLTFVVGITVIGSIWDIWATKHGKRDPVWLWQFNFRYTLGLKLFDLPIEEYLFYVASSVYVIFVWEGIKFALETGNLFMYFLLPFLGIWSFLAVVIPYLIKVKEQ